MSKYYHGTSDIFTGVMREEGLIPREDTVFCDSSRRIASGHAQLTVDRLGGKPVLVTIESEKVPQDLIQKETAWDFFAEEIPPEAIINIQRIQRE